MSLAKKYYRVLGLQTTADLDDVDEAYEARFKTTHPQINKSPFAREEFTELVLAYGYVKKLIEVSFNEQDADFIEWWSTEENKLKKRALQLAFMPLEKAIDPEDYAMNQAIDVIFKYILVLFVTGIIGIEVYVMVWLSGADIASLLITAFFLAITLPLYTLLLKSLRSYQYSLASLAQSLKTVGISDWFLIGITAITNFIILGNVAMNTFVESKVFFFLYALLPVMVFAVIRFVLKKHKYYNRKLTISFVVLPLIINSIFVLNYLGSSNPRTETYKFEKNIEEGLITLENRTYSKYGVIRFLSADAVRSSNTVSYTIEDGLLGMRVVKDYKLTLEFRTYE